MNKVAAMKHLRLAYGSAAKAGGPRKALHLALVALRAGEVAVARRFCAIAQNLLEAMLAHCYRYNVSLNLAAVSVGDAEEALGGASSASNVEWDVFYADTGY